MIKLGTVVTDRVTGIKGVAVARTTWLYDCVRIRIQPKSEDPTKVLDGYWADEKNLAEDDGFVPSKPVILGQVVTDSLSGFRGTAVYRAEYINSGPRVGVQPKGLEVNTGKPIESQDFDEAQLVEFSKIYPSKSSTQKRQITYGPGPSCPKREAR